MKNHQITLIKTIGRRIKAFRKSKGLTQQELSDRVGIHHKYIGEIERGRQNPSLASLKNIADGLDIDIIDLFQLEMNFQNRESAIQEIDKIIQSMPEDKIIQVLFLLRTLSTL